MGFFFSRRRDWQCRKNQGITMITINIDEGLTREEMLAALTHSYLELRLSLHAAQDAAEADLQILDASELVAEAT